MLVFDREEGWCELPINYGYEGIVAVSLWKCSVICLSTIVVVLGRAGQYLDHRMGCRVYDRDSFRLTEQNSAGPISDHWSVPTVQLKGGFPPSAISRFPEEPEIRQRGCEWSRYVTEPQISLQGRCSEVD